MKCIKCGTTTKKLTGQAENVQACLFCGTVQYNLVIRKLDQKKEMMSHFQYRSRKWLEKKINKEVIFFGWHDCPPKKGIIKFDQNKYWLPWCGYVNAETVKICEI